MAPDEISQTVRIAEVRYSVHFTPATRRVRVHRLPENATVEGLREAQTVLASGDVRRDGVVWDANSIGAIASVAASWTVDYVLEADCLLVFIDETGAEDLSDPAYPIFGLGGCAVRAEDYPEVIAGPWRLMKLRHFGGVDAAMHASELRDPTPDQVAALARFFTESPFYRIAGVMDITTQLDSQMMTKYEVVAGMLARNIGAIVQRAQPSRLSAVFESSQRGDRLGKAFFPRLQIESGDANVPATWGSMKKQQGEPGLEVADFVIHTAGAQVRARASGRDAWRKDFKCVFQDASQALVEFAYIRKFGVVRNPLGTREGISIPIATVPIKSND